MARITAVTLSYFPISPKDVSLLDINDNLYFMDIKRQREYDTLLLEQGQPFKKRKLDETPLVQIESTPIPPSPESLQGLPGKRVGDYISMKTDAPNGEGIFTVARIEKLLPDSSHASVYLVAQRDPYIGVG